VRTASVNAAHTAFVCRKPVAAAAHSALVWNRPFKLAWEQRAGHAWHRSAGTWQGPAQVARRKQAARKPLVQGHHPIGGGGDAALMPPMSSARTENGRGKDAGAANKETTSRQLGVLPSTSEMLVDAAQLQPLSSLP
jgi:hypothetical protein